MKNQQQRMQKSLGPMSYNDLRQELQGIVQQKFGKKSQNGDYYTDYPWIEDVYENEFVVSKNGKYYIADYKVDKEGNVTIGQFYPAKKVYRQASKTPAVKIGGRGSGGDVAVG